MTPRTSPNRSQPNGDLLRQALIAAKCTAGNDGTYVHASMDDVLAALAPAVATGEPNLLLLQARYVLKNLNAERPGCGYDKLATACEEAALPPAKAAGYVRAAVIEALAQKPGVSAELSREWRCFHCDEVFTDPKAAANHFGVDHLGSEVLCQMAQVDGGIAKVVADLAEELNRYRCEDNESFREFYRLGADHVVALGSEEEKGYARGLKDGQAFAKIPGNLFWMAAKGRLKPSEPLYAVQIIDPENGVHLTATEAETLEEAISASVSALVPPNNADTTQPAPPSTASSGDAQGVPDPLERCKYCGNGPCENCMNSGYAYPDRAELALAAIELAKLPGDVYWLLAKGRARPDEPLWAVQLTDLDANKIAEAEGDHPADCVRAAWASPVLATDRGGLSEEEKTARAAALADARERARR